MVKQIVTTPEELITNEDETQPKISIVDPHKIVRKQGKLYTIPQKKDYRLVYDKRIIGPNYVTYPYGWKGPQLNITQETNSQ